MNAQLLNPFTLDIPDSVSQTFSTAECTTLLFNHGHNSLSGQYLAVGRADGLITIWDIETKSVLRVLVGHVRAVSGLAWSSGNRYLASCASDWNVIVWDLAAKTSAGPVLRAVPTPHGVEEERLSGEGSDKVGIPFASERKRTVRFDCAVSSVQFAPGNSKKLVVVLSSNQAFLIDIDEKVRMRSKKASASASKEPPLQVEDVESDPVRTALTIPSGDGEQDSAGPGITAARFTPDGRFIVAGTSKGGLLVFDGISGELLDEKKVLGSVSGVKELAFDAPGRFLVVNSNDRAIRVLSVSTTSLTQDDSDSNSSRSTKRRKTSLELTLLHKLQDTINRTAWVNIGFSPSSDYIYAGAAHKASHNVYIYDRTSGVLEKILEGPKDWLIGVDWHPNRPILASVSNAGVVYVWFTPTEEIWSAYAMGFEELEENREYEEREDEFDFYEGRDQVEARRLVEEEAAFVRVIEQPWASRSALVGKYTPNLSAHDLFDRLDVALEARNSRLAKALESIALSLGEITSDSGWLQSGSQNTNGEAGSESEQVRELVFSLVDDDAEDTFVIPPRLEADYSHFHDDHI